MRIWTRLKHWVDEESESAEMYLRISEAAALYQIGRTGLWRPPDLQLALNWQKKQVPTRYWAQRYDEAFERAIVFLDTSRITYESEQENQELLQKRILKRTRVFAAFLGIAAIIAIAFGLLSLTNKIQADKERGLAEDSKLEAEQARDDAVNAQTRAESATLDALLSERDANNAKDLMEQANKELAVALINEKSATAAAYDAAIRAENNAIKAAAAAKEALRQQGIAEAATLLARDRQMLAIAAALAGKSLRERNSELRALMAQQSYSYNAKFGGSEFDNMIYDALYYSLAAFGGEDYNMFSGHRGAVKSVVFSGIGSQFFSTGSDGKIYQWNLNDNKLPAVLVDGEKSSYSNRGVKISPDKKWLLSTSDSATMKLYKIDDLTAKPILITGHRGLVRDAEFMPDNSGIVSVGSDGTISFYDFTRSRLLKQLENVILNIEIEPNGNYIYGGTRQGKVVRIAMKDMKETVIANSQDGEMITSLAINNKGRSLAYGQLSGEVSIFDLLLNKSHSVLHGHTARVSSVAFSNNGKRLATASWDGTIQIWNMENLDDLPYYLTENGGDAAFAWDLTFSPLDDYLVVGTKEGKIKKWAIDNATLADQICQHLSRNMTPEEWDRYVSDEVEYETTCKNVQLKDNS